MSRTKLDHRYLVIIGLLILVFARLAVDAQKLSLTTDEPFHIASGYSYLVNGATWTTPLRGHPLLVDAWCALPLFMSRPDIPVEELSGWGNDHIAYLKAFVSYINEDIERYEVLSRVPIMLLTVLLAAVVARWSQDLWGPKGTVVALLILAFDPSLIAHGMLATNDVGVTALGTLALSMTYRLGRKRASPHHLVITGLIYGLTMLAKSSGIIWVVGGMVMLGLMQMRRSTWKKALSLWIMQSISIIGLAVLAVWAFYGFEFGSVDFVPIEVPAPTHWTSVVLQAESPTRREIYYLGRVENEGWWLYFPLAFLLKNPLPLLTMLGWVLVRWIQSRRVIDGLILGAFPLIYTIVAVSSGLNIGYRHLLPIHPFFYLSIGGLASRRRNTRIAVVGLIAWLGLESVLIAPHHLTYFNQLVGRPNQGWRYLGDSNTDWGQAHKILRDYQESTDRSFYYSGKSVYVGYPTYGIDAEPLPPLRESFSPVMQPWIRPDPGYYVISANSLAGLGCTEPDNFAWFRHHQPEEVLGHVLFVYQVPPHPETTWIAQCITPTMPLDSETRDRGFPTASSRRIAFDCTQSWVIPQRSGELGWYVLHDELFDREFETLERMGLMPIQPDDLFVAARTADLDLSYRQWHYRGTPAYGVYASSSPFSPEEPDIGEGFIGPAETQPKVLMQPTSNPIPIVGPLDYLGATSALQSNELEITTWWKVDGPSPEWPTSIMAHLLSAEGETLGIADGLGFTVENWLPGDVIIQRHRFELQSPPSELWLRTGVYWLVSGERWPVGRQGDAIFVRLPEHQSAYGLQ